MVSRGQRRPVDRMPTPHPAPVTTALPYAAVVLFTVLLVGALVSLFTGLLGGLLG
ncbi:hypothetical protein [Parasulfuritortus cantonensis]|uniref:hypothetical protein n=1 Tax=Parasulfuritortus cantonensis TaxID=2528202 RepID=UPI001404FFA7|nr:hypothetical protein [Parasulfuritortus cantonensis]